MTVTLKTEITVPKIVRRKAGFKAGDRVEFKVSNRTITIVPKLTPDEVQDEEEIRDPKIRAAIRWLGRHQNEDGGIHLSPATALRRYECFPGLGQCRGQSSDNADGDDK